MGACCGPMLDENTRNINKTLQQEAIQKAQIHKLLFLGPGGSGKSTIFRQLQWLHGDGFTKDEALMVKKYIYEQITTQMKHVINTYLLIDNDQSAGKPYRSIGGIPINATPSSSGSEHKETTELDKAISIIQKTHADITTFDDEIASAVQYIWKYEPKIRNVFKYLESNTDEKVSEHLDETTEYFWNEIDRIKSPHYIPNDEDIMNVRYRTIGIIDKTFEIKGAKFNIFDVGGQKSERKKWINCFNEVKAVVFVVSLSCFNEPMFEDGTKNCMIDAMELFESTINNKHFKETNIILFLNKRDLFQKKILKIPITDCPAFNDYDENPNNYEQSVVYIRYKFLELNKSHRENEIYSHLTCAMDRRNIEKVFNDIQHIIINQCLGELGLNSEVNEEYEEW